MVTCIFTVLVFAFNYMNELRKKDFFKIIMLITNSDVSVVDFAS